MKYKLKIYNFENVEWNIGNENNRIQLYDDTIEMSILNDEKVEAFYQDKKTLKKYIEYFKIENDLTSENLNKIMNIDFDNYIDNVEYILFNIDVDVLKYIKENPIILTKKIVIDKTLNFDECIKYDELLALKEKYISIFDKLYFNVSGNSEYTSLENTINTLKPIIQIKDKIKSLNLSPIEEIMYAYDLLKEKIYTKEDKNDSYNESRDLKNVILGDKIVCVGYANVFGIILKYLNIPNWTYKLCKYEKGIGHVRNVAYVKDDKYDIDGVYYFDVTWDSKKNENDNAYLQNYDYFARTKDYMDKQSGDLVDEQIPLSINDLYKQIKQFINDKDENSSVQYYLHLVKPFYRYTDRFYETMKIVSEFNIIKKEELLRSFEELYKKFKKEISADTMYEIIMNVRRIQHYEEPEKYPFSKKEIFNTFMKNNWLWNDDYRVIEIERIMEIKTNILELRKIRIQDKLKDDKSFEQVEITKVLKKYLEKRTN